MNSLLSFDRHSRRNEVEIGNPERINVVNLLDKKLVVVLNEEIPDISSILLQKFENDDREAAGKLTDTHL